jgi:hypothetical protein
LIILAASWPPFEAAYQETEQLIADRAQRGVTTWLVSPVFEQLKTTRNVPTSFNEMIRVMRTDRFVHYSLLETFPDKVKKNNKVNPVLDITKGHGMSGVDQSLLSFNKSVEVRVTETEKHFVKNDSYVSDGQPQSK